MTLNPSKNKKDKVPPPLIARCLAYKLFAKWIIGSIFLAFLATYTPPTFTLPQGGQVNAGKAVITSPNGNTLIINQSTDKAVIDWHSFNLQQREATHFRQPSTRSITLNRIDPRNGASAINGYLTANGQVWLVNPAGIVFGATARVDVGGILATTAGISNDDFMAGRYHFVQSPDWHGAVINNGSITVAEEGIAALVGPGVENNGVINARMGKVALAAGNEFTVDFYGDQLINFGMNAAVSERAVTPEGRALRSAVSNTGTINANGGRVLLTARTAGNVLDHSINMSGNIEAKTAMQRGGSIILMGGDNGTVRVSGKMDVSGKQYAQSGGKIKILGNKIKLVRQAKIDASGDVGGGEILIGGDYQGKNSAIPNAARTFVGSKVSVNADALTAGNGGKVIVFANDTTHFYGKVSARGGSASGNGGFVETSGKGFLNVEGASVDLRATAGKTGTWLLDPTNIYIATNQANATGAGMSGTNSSANVGTGGNPNTFAASGVVQDSLLTTGVLQTALSTANVVVTTDNPSGTGAGNITVVNPFSWATSNTLSLIAANNIAINAAITTGAAGSALILNAGNAVTQSAIISGAGGLQITGPGTVTLNQLNTYTGGTTITSGTVNVNVLANAGTASSLGSGTASPIINLGNATLLYTGTGHSSNRAINLTGSGTLNASGSGTLTLSGGITGTQNLILTGTGTGIESGAIATTTGNVTKDGVGTWRLSGTNTYSGITTINNGILQIGNAGTTGTLGTGDVTNNATLQFNRTNAITVNNIIHGAGTLIQAGTNTLTLAGANDYSGATLINTGTLAITNASGLGSATGGTTVASGATLNINNVSVSSGETITLNGIGAAGVGALTGTGAGANINASAIVLGSNSSFGGAGTLTLDGTTVISGPFNLTKIGAGTLVLNTANTYSGKTSVTAGTLSFNSIGDVNGGNTSLGAPTTIANGTIDLTGTLTYTGTGHATDRIINLTGTSLITGSGTGGLTLNGNITGANQNLTLQGSNTNNIVNGAIATGNGSLTKTTTAGTWILAGTNTYSGTTTITQGILQIGNGGTSGTLGLGDVTVSGTLRFNRSNSLNVANNIGGTGALTQIGTGIVTLTPAIANTYSGTTTVSAGTLQAGAVNALSPASAISLANTANTFLDLNNFSNTIRSLAGGGALGGNVTLGSGTLTLQNNANTVFSGIINGSGGLTVNAGAAFSQSLAGANLYTGPTIINTGTLSITNANGLGSGANQSSSILVNSGGALNMAFTTNTLGNTNLITLNGTGPAGAGALTAGASTDTLTNNIGLNTDSAIGGNSNMILSGIISGSGNLTKAGTGTLTLSGANSYTGKTSVTAGTLSFNSIADVNGGDSALGAPASIANGTIDLTGTLTYTGSGHASDRVINLTGTGTINASGTGALNLSGGITGLNQNLTLSGSATGANASIESGAIATGAGTLTKTTAGGTWILAGNNTYSGLTTVNQGILQIGNGGVLGTLGSNDVLINANATLRFDRSDTITVTNNISGAGGLTQQGSGVVILTPIVANNYSGATTVTAGTLRAGMVNAFSATSAVTLANAANTFLDLNNFNNTIRTLAGGGALGGNVTLGLGAGGTLTTQNNATTTFSGIISGNGGLTINGAGFTQTLAGANTYTGTTLINAGTLAITNATGLGSAAGGTSVAAGATLNINNVTISNGEALTLEGLGVSGAGALTGTNTARINQSLINLVGDTTLGGAGTLNLDGNTVIGGAFNLTKTGTGTLVLGGANLYSGKTIINAGTVSINSIANVGGGSSALGAPTTVGNGTIDLAGTLTYTGSGSASDRIINLTGAGIINGSGTGALNLSGGVTGTNQNLTLSGTATGANASIESGVIATGSGTLTKSGTGIWSLSGANTYSGQTSITAGTLRVNNIANVGSGSSALGAPVSVANGTINLGTATLAYVGAGDTSDRVINLTGSGIIDSSGTGNLNLTGGITGTQNLTLTGSTNATETGIISTNTGNVTKTGAAIWHLAGANTYSGLTTISVGTLQIQNAMGLGSTVGATSVASGATLIIDNIAIGNESLNLNNGAILNGIGTASLDGNISLIGTLGTSRTISTTNAADSISLNGTINGNAPLILTGPGNIIFANTVGDSSPVRTITSNVGGTLTINGGSVVTTGTQTYNGIVALGAPTTFEVTAANADIFLTNVANNISQPITFATSGAGTIRDITLVNTSALANLPLGFPASVRNLILTFNNAGITLPTLTVTNTLTLTAGNGDIVQSGVLNASAADAIFNAGTNNIVLNNVNNLLDNVFLNGNNATLAAADAYNLGASTIVSTLNLTAGGTLTQSGPISATTLVLTNLGGNTTFANPGNVITQLGNINVTGRNLNLVNTTALTQQGGTAITGNTLTLNTSGGLTMNGANTVTAFNGTNAASGNIVFNNVGANLLITGLNQNAAGGAVSLTNSGVLQNSGSINSNGGNINLTGSSILLGNNLTSAGGMINLNSPVTLNNTVTANAGNGGINFASTVNGPVNNLILQNNSGATGTVTFANNVTLGALTTFSQPYSVIFNGLSNSITNAVTFNNTAGVTFANGGTSQFNSGMTNTASITTLNGALNALNNAITVGAVSLTGNSAMTTLAGSINFMNQVTGAHTLTLNSGSSDITFSAPATLAALTIANANNVTNNATIAVNSFTQNAGTGTTNLGNNSLHATGLASIGTYSVYGNVVVGGLALNVNFANLTGSVAGQVGNAAANIITLLNPISPGTHFFDGIDLFKSPPPSPNPTPTPNSNLLSTIPQYIQYTPEDFFSVENSGSDFTVEQLLELQKKGCVILERGIAACQGS